MEMSNDRPDMSGALFRAKEQKNENSPPYTGRIKIAGVEYRLAAWVNESKTSGEKYFSLKVSEEQERQTQKPATQRKTPEDDPDALPF
jgi:uncharacterized protein (DUF736 family)